MTDVALAAFSQPVLLVCRRPPSWSTSQIQCPPLPCPHQVSTPCHFVEAHPEGPQYLLTPQRHLMLLTDHRCGQALGDRGWRDSYLPTHAWVVVAGCGAGVGSLHEPQSGAQHPLLPSAINERGATCDGDACPQGLCTACTGARQHRSQRIPPLRTSV